MAGIDSYTKLMLHCDGADGSQTFTDEIGKTVTAVGNAQIDTAQYKFGGASALFDGNGDYLSLADSDDWYFGTGDWTIDFWVRFNGSMVFEGFFQQWVDTGNLVSCFWNTNKNIYLYYRSGGSDISVNVAPWDAAISTWYHVAIVSNSSVIDFFVDGIKLSKSSSQNFGTYPNLATTFKIGRAGDGSSEATYNLNGWIDEIRVSKGIARWTANFTPPSRAYYRASGGFGFGNPWIFLKDAYDKHKKLWTPKGLILPQDLGFSY